MNGVLNGEPISSSGLATKVIAGRAPASCSAATAWRPASSPAFMSVTPGPKARSPLDRYGRCGGRPGSKTVSMCPMRSTPWPFAAEPSDHEVAELRARRRPARGGGARHRRRAREAHRSRASATRLTPSAVYEPQSMLTRVSSSARKRGRRASTMRRSASRSGMVPNILTPMPPEAGSRDDGVELVELRVLDGPNRFFTRPAVKLEFAGTEPGQAAEAAAERRAGREAAVPCPRPARASHDDAPLGRRPAHRDRLPMAPPNDLARPSARRRRAWRWGARPIDASWRACGRSRSARCRTCRSRASRSWRSPARTGRARRPASSPTSPPRPA